MVVRPGIVTISWSRCAKLGFDFYRLCSLSLPTVPSRLTVEENFEVHICPMVVTEKVYSRPSVSVTSLLWRHNGHDCLPNHQPHHCLLNCLFGRRSKKTSTLRVTGLCVGNSPGTGEIPAQMASNAQNVSIWRRHHDSVSKSPFVPVSH